MTGRLLVRLLDAKFKAEFLANEQHGPRVRAESQEFADAALVESYLQPFMPFIPDDGRASDLVRKVRLEGSVTRYICCAEFDLEGWVRQS